MVRDMDGRPPSGPSDSALLLCVQRECTVGRSPWVSRPMEPDLLSVLSIYPKIFSRVFIVYRLLVGFLFVLLYSTICSCVLVVLV